MCDLVQDVARNVLCHSQGHCVHNWKHIAKYGEQPVHATARCLCPLKIGMAQQSLASARPVGLASLAEHAGMHSSLPLFQTQHTGIILKVSFDNPSYKKNTCQRFALDLAEDNVCNDGSMASSHAYAMPGYMAMPSHRIMGDH